MKNQTFKLRSVMLLSSTVDELENEHKLYKFRVKLKDENEMDIKYHKTINKIFNTIKEAGWSLDFSFTENSEVSFTLASDDNLEESKHNL